MNRIFRRFVVLVMLAITLATVVIYFTFRQLFGDPFEQLAQRQAAGQIFLLEQYIDRAPADEWLARLNKVREVSGAEIELIPLKAAMARLPARKRTALLDGAIVFDVGDKALYRRVDRNGQRYIDSDNDVIFARKLPIDIGQALGMEAIRFIIVALCLLAPIAWWSRAHWRTLQQLSRTADAFGAGQLDARATPPAGSSVAPLAGRFNDMAARIGQLLEARKHLLHAVSHELRTPIARLAFGLELLRKDAANPALAPRLAQLEADVEELNALVNELLSLTRLDHQSAPARQSFALDALLRDCLDGAAAAQPARRFDSAIADGLGPVNADRRLLARALANLLGNAAKYAQGRIVLSAHQAGPDAIHIAVEDDGPGIPPDARERVFEPFHRLDREQDHAVGGYGLGLAIARKAVQLHGGTLSVDRSTLGGARFLLILPMA